MKGLWRVSGKWRGYMWSWHSGLSLSEGKIAKFISNKDCLRIMRVKRQLKGLDPAVVDLPEETEIFINESLYPYYREIWNKCKKLWNKQKLYQYYTINGSVCLWIEESGQVKTITNILDWQNLFPHIEIDSSWLYVFSDNCWWSFCCAFFEILNFLSYIYTLLLICFFCH